MDSVNTANALYYGWNAEDVRERRRDDDATSSPALISSSFTAINQRPKQLLTPKSSAPIQQNQARRRANGGRRRHNPAVAQYLGLGSQAEPTHLGKYVPLPDVPASPPTEPVRKRPKLADGENILSRTMREAGGQDVSKQPRVSESFRVTKPARKSAASRSKTAASKASQPSSHAPDSHSPLVDDGGSPNSHQSHMANNDASPRSARTISQETGTNDPGQPECRLPKQQAWDTFDDDDDDFGNDIGDDDLLMLTSDIGDACVTNANNSGSPTKPSNYREDHGDVGSTKARKPIARRPFPNAVRDRSPIIGLSSSAFLRTCFRIGEAINQSCQASKSGKNVMIELYARVFESERTDTTQQFTFCDLFHVKPPYIKGIYGAAVWKTVQLFEYDSRRLLQQGRMCRCIGTMKREGKEWVMTVLNIWEATWEDMKWVEGIVSF